MKTAERADWRANILDRMRALMKEVDPKIVETRKWRDVPVFERDGIICTGETYKDKVKFTFAKGAFLPDPDALFNSSLDGNLRRAIDVFEGDRIKETALKKLIRAAIKLNQERKR